MKGVEVEEARAGAAAAVQAGAAEGAQAAGEEEAAAAAEARLAGYRLSHPVEWSR